MAFPGIGDPNVTTWMSAAGHCSAAQTPAMEATPAPRLWPLIFTSVGCWLPVCKHGENQCDQAQRGG